MSYIVDTNVFSERTKKHPDPKVEEWFEAHQRQLFVSAVTIAEIRRGVERLPESLRKQEVRQWLQHTCRAMQKRVLSFNTSVAHVWGQHKAIWEKQGITLPILDSQIAATAIRHNLTVATRNTKDFAPTGIKTANPFEFTPG